MLLCCLAIASELFWRGLVVDWLEERLGPRRAWIGAVLISALAQLPAAFVMRDPHGGPNPLPVLEALGNGFLWGGLARMTGRLAPSIIAHTLFLACVVLMFRLWGPSV
jgi:membrane protease YdiL (CAAX protease family)